MCLLFGIFARRCLIIDGKNRPMKTPKKKLSLDGDRMIYIGKIDLEMYRCVASDILTDEVIITEKQIQHIFNSHPGCIHSSTLTELSTAIAEPDYILQDTQTEHISDTAIVMKKIHREDGGCRVILRLATSSDDEEKKNSIITAFYISEKKWNKYLRNKIILYKRL